VFVCLCRGEYDSILEWPFTHRITFDLIDQTDTAAVQTTAGSAPQKSASDQTESGQVGQGSGKGTGPDATVQNGDGQVQQVHHIEAAVTPAGTKDNLPYIIRPVGERNKCFGKQKFCALETLHKFNYIRDDTVFLRLSIDMDKVPPIL